ncbi:unnamed protein product [Orchesella dallaii]|uniref:Uncharacterized protein n=1 Tax=Orchesella dallaii TaxID=48710 RepID=A0ABP1S0J3_9HEXA
MSEEIPENFWDNFSDSSNSSPDNSFSSNDRAFKIIDLSHIQVGVMISPQPNSSESEDDSGSWPESLDSAEPSESSELCTASDLDALEAEAKILVQSKYELNACVNCFFVYYYNLTISHCKSRFAEVEYFYKAQGLFYALYSNFQYCKTHCQLELCDEHVLKFMKEVLNFWKKEGKQTECSGQEVGELQNLVWQCGKYCQKDAEVGILDSIDDHPFFYFGDILTQNGSPP